jgi:hypothetical protein
MGFVAVDGSFTEYLVASLILILISIFSITPFIPEYVPNFFEVHGRVMTRFYRGLLAFVLMIFAIILLTNHNEAQIENMTPEELAEHIEAEARSELQRQQSVWRENEEALKHGSSIDGGDDKETDYEDDIDTDNDNQRDFYDQLGSPKMLYKCDGSPFEKAIGSTHGTYNLLLKEVTSDCGSGFDVIKSDK